jgi:hypothetical protein
MSKKEFIIVFDLKIGVSNYGESFDKIIDYLHKETFRNESIKISSRALYCYAAMPERYPDLPALIDDAFCALIEKDFELDDLSGNYVAYHFQPDIELMNNLKSNFPFEIEYLINRK